MHYSRALKPPMPHTRLSPRDWAAWLAMNTTQPPHVDHTHQECDYVHEIRMHRPVMATCTWLDTSEDSKATNALGAIQHSGLDNSPN